MDDVTQKREKFFKNVRYGGVGILAVLLLPLIFFLSMLAAGAVAAAWIAVVGGLALNYSIDPISRKLANWRIKPITDAQVVFIAIMALLRQLLNGHEIIISLNTSCINV